MTRSGRHVVTTAAVGAACMLALPAAASAGTVQFRQSLLFTAAPGERNQVDAAVLVLEGDDEIEVRDSGATLTPGEGCRSLSANVARCTIPNGIGIVEGTIELGDGDDRGSMTNGSFVLRGGSGDDQLTGGPASDQISGGPGADTIRGGDGGDLLDGGGGRDTLLGEGDIDGLTDGDTSGAVAGDADVLDGETVDYTRRTRPVRVDLRAGTGGEAGESDRLVNVDGVRGGRASDELLGSDRRDAFDGGRGRDVVKGRGGDDDITATTGDRIFTDTGNDLVRARTDIDAGIACGAGRDSVELLPVGGRRGRNPVGPLVEPGCERMRVNFDPSSDDGPVPYLPQPVRSTRAGRLTFQVGCFRRCRARLTLTGDRPRLRRLTTTRFRAPAFRARRVGVRLPRGFTRRARRSQLVLRVRIDGAGGTPAVWRIRVRLRAGP